MPQHIKHRRGEHLPPIFAAPAFVIRMFFVFRSLQTDPRSEDFSCMNPAAISSLLLDWLSTNVSALDRACVQLPRVCGAAVRGISTCGRPCWSAGSGVHVRCHTAHGHPCHTSPTASLRHSQAHLSDLHLRQQKALSRASFAQAPQEALSSVS